MGCSNSHTAPKELYVHRLTEYITTLRKGQWNTIYELNVYDCIRLAIHDEVANHVHDDGIPLSLLQYSVDYNFAPTPFKIINKSIVTVILVHRNARA